MASDPNRDLLPPPEARKRFGRTLYIWRLRAGWRQDTLHEWGKASGFPGATDAVWNKLENGKTPQPLPLTFIQLAMANERLANKDYGVIRDRKLKDLVQAQAPICNDSGVPWTASDFFGHFVGLVDPPEWAANTKGYLLNDEEAQKLSTHQREMFVRYAQDRLMDRLEAWQELQNHCNGMSREQVEAFKLVLGGHRSWSAAELSEMTDQAGKNLTIAALQSWCDEDSLCKEFRNMCPD